MELEGLIEQTLENFCIPAGPRALEQLIGFMEELERWNRSINLVGLKGMEQVCRELLADALFLNTQVNDRHSLVDVGSGSGILAVPVAVLNEGITVRSIDSNLKKIQFQRHVRRKLDLENFLPVHARIEAMEPLGADGLIAKAFGTVEDILAAADRHLSDLGLVFMARGKEEKERPYSGYELVKALSYSLPAVPKTYRLLVYKKVS